MSRKFISKKITPSHKSDRMLLVLIFLILGFGLIILSSVSLVISQERFDKPYYYFFHQLLGVGIGLSGFFLTSKIHYKFWKKSALFIMLLSIIALILVFVPGLGFGYGGAKRWLNLKFFSFQPSELVKLGFIIYLAAWLATKKTEKIKTFAQSTLPFLIIAALIGVLIIAQPDIGTFGVIALIGITIFFLGGAKISHILSLIACGFIALFALIKIAPYRMNRFLTFLKPDIDTLGIGYQIKQALLAIGSGGLFGLGLGHSRQRYNYLPSPASDSIFAIIAEEIGFVGTTILILLFLNLALRGFRIAKNSPDKFARLTAAGITSWIIVQTFINILAITGLIPLTGITLPFISYGSSSMVASLIGAGILINISKYTQ